MSSLSHVLSSPRQHSFVPDGGPAKLTFGLSAPQKVTASFRTAAWLLYSNRAPIFIAPCGREAMQNYFGQLGTSHFGATAKGAEYLFDFNW